MMKPPLSRRCSLVVLAVGFILLAVCLILMLIFPTLYNNLLHKELVLNRESPIFDKWKNIPIPIYESVYFFNVTNADEFLYHGAKLNVTEVGPYTYKSKWEKTDIGWFANKTISYREIRTYHFVPEQSNGTEDDIIVTLNAPMLMAAKFFKGFNVPIKLLVSFLLGLENEKLLVEKSVRQLTYDGYEDPIVKYGIYVMPNIPYKSGLFGWLYGKNATDDGLVTVFTGKDDIQKLSLIDNYNGAKSLGVWKDRPCDMINGTNAEMGPPLNDNQETYTFFQSIMCRSWTLQYSKDDTVLGIPCKTFITTSDLLGNKSVNPDNYCFETAKNTPSGVLDISNCQFGAPVYLSLPHFYLGDPSFLHEVNGVTPSSEDHGSYIKVHPTTGFSVDLALRFQINLKLESELGILQLDKVREGIFPILWVDLHGTVDEDLADFLRSRLENPKIIFYSLVGVFLALAIVMIIAAFISLIILWVASKKDDDELLINPEKDNVKNANPRKSGHGASLSSADEPPKHFGEIGDSPGISPGEDDEPLLDAGVGQRQTSEVGFRVKN